MDHIHSLVESRIPTEYGEFIMHAFHNASHPDQPHLALVSAEHKTGTTPLVRIHSECCTGDIFASLRCDCGEQLKYALQKIGKEGGVIIYLRQEGRGIGLLEKLRAYKLQDSGLDTVEANLQLGYAADIRDYTMAANILSHFGIHEIRLLTNNPDKIQSLNNLGIQVISRIPIIIPTRKENEGYMETKKSKLGHILD